MTRTTWHGWAVAALVAVFFVQISAESRLKSPTSDEPPHIASGLSYVATGIFRSNPEHPPLLKELSGLSLLVGGVRWPRNATTEALLHGERATDGQQLQPEWEIGNGIIADNGPDHALFWARLPLMLIASALGVLLFAWGRSIVGSTAAVFAVFVYTTDPTILAHAFLVTTDVGLAAFTVALLFALWRYVHNPTVPRLLVCGLALGAVLCAKFSAVLLLPAVALLILAAIIWPVTSTFSRARTQLDPFWRDTGGGGQSSRRPGRKTPAATSNLPKQFATGAAAFAVMCVVAGIAIQALYFFPSDPLLYLHGLNEVNANHRPDAEAYLAGELHHSFRGYFAAAYLLKQPIAGIVLTFTGFAMFVRNKSIAILDKLFLFVPAFVLFVGPSLLAHQIGIRYVLPSFPFAHLLSGLAVATLLAATTKWKRGVAVALCAWLLIADGGIFPDHLSYFNESACLLTTPARIGVDGGSRCGVQWLDDSNIDWGQGLRQLKAWADEHSETRTIRYASIYGFPPTGYGLTTVRPPEPELLGQPIPGLYAISASIVARLNAIPGSNWANIRPPTAIVGHSLYVFDVR